MIPGPVSCSKEVLDTLCEDSQSHTGKEFHKTFQKVIQQLYKLFHSSEESGSLPLVLAGSGTLGFDIVGNNLFQDREDRILVLSTGYFSDEFKECLGEYYGYNVDCLQARDVGYGIDCEELAGVLQEKGSGYYQGVVMTQVDTSTGVLLDVESLSSVIREMSPETLIIVDSVCALGCETMLFDEWGVDFVVSASQKAIGAPAGLFVGMISKRAITIAMNNKRPMQNYYTSLKKWIPSLQSYSHHPETPVKYFATPPVQLVGALNMALTQLLNRDYIQDQLQLYNWFFQELHRRGLEVVPRAATPDQHAHGFAAVYLSDPPRAISHLKMFQNIVIANGIHPRIKKLYLRVGLLNVGVSEKNCKNNRKNKLTLVLDTLARVNGGEKESHWNSDA